MLEKDYNQNLYTETKYLYQTCIHNFNKLNKAFGFNEVCSINASFLFALEQGYLSASKKLLKKGSYQDIIGLSGADVILGHGVCRHISCLLKDVFNDNQIQSIPLITSTHESSMIEKILGNHMIVFATKEDKKIIIDALNHYYLKQKGSKIYQDSLEKWKIKMYATKLWVENVEQESWVKYKKLLTGNLLNISEEEALYIEKKVMNICSKNRYMYEKLFLENYEMYKEIEDKLVRIRKRENVK